MSQSTPTARNASHCHQRQEMDEYDHGFTHKSTISLFMLHTSPFQNVDLPSVKSTRVVRISRLVSTMSSCVRKITVHRSRLMTQECVNRCVISCQTLETVSRLHGAFFKSNRLCCVSRESVSVAMWQTANTPMSTTETERNQGSPHCSLLNSFPPRLCEQWPSQSYWLLLLVIVIVTRSLLSEREEQQQAQVRQ